MSDARGVLASPHCVIGRSGRSAEDHRRIADIVREWQIERIVVGLPLSLDGSVGRAARQAQREARELGAATGVPVETYDERLTTVSAHQILRDQGVAGPARRQVVDKVAAAVLLQAWLDAHREPAPEQPHDSSDSQ
jgi:putative Holliday junction resolvase